MTQFPEKKSNLAALRAKLPARAMATETISTPQWLAQGRQLPAPVPVLDRLAQASNDEQVEFMKAMFRNLAELNRRAMQ